MKIVKLLGLLLVSILPALAAAAPLKPNSGLWWEEPTTGRFFAVEIAPSGKTYVVISEFDATGKPVWKAMRGELEVKSEQEQLAGGPLAVLTAPLLELDGACLTCPPVAPNVRAVATATIVFQTHAVGEYQEGGLRRPLRYFLPADQLSDFPAARLAGEYVLAYRDSVGLSARTLMLEPSRQPECVRRVGRPAPANATRFSASCPLGLCPGGRPGEFALGLELAVGPGEHPEIIAYKRTFAPEAFSTNLNCTILFSPCRCPAGFSLNTFVGTGSNAPCVRDDAPMLCTESHRISEQHGVIAGLPLSPNEHAFQLFPAR